MTPKYKGLTKRLIHFLVFLSFTICASQFLIMDALIGTRIKQDFFLSWLTELKIGLGLFAASIIGASILLHILDLHLLTFNSGIERLKGGGYLKRYPDFYFGEYQPVDNEFDELLIRAEEQFQKNNR